jgi:hypothetical protein
MATRAAAGGGRWVDVDPARLPRWLDNFATRHAAAADAPPVTIARFRAIPTGDGVTTTAPDGCVAELYWPPGAQPGDDFVAIAQEPRRIGLLLARQAAVAVGIATGASLEVSKVDSSYVQGRTAAGGWSQQRFARRRTNQAKAAAADASDLVVRLLLPQVGTLATVVTGGDRRAVEAVLADPRLSPVRALRDERFLEVAEPRRAVLEQAVAGARAVRIRILDAGHPSR